ncbi:hypothetical protein NDU88_001719 [Pleurodeles waltl]|uniref:Uncharacterized protein n=1 Tax=Pleurodeles waltl TaxID=8319 RepID=A0AAV7W1A1_PLEWA|nr:hypothetical protein NDU88_001719 [Pleurodeles waltl]
MPDCTLPMAWPLETPYRSKEKAVSGPTCLTAWETPQPGLELDKGVGDREQPNTCWGVASFGYLGWCEDDKLDYDEERLLREAETVIDENTGLEGPDRVIMGSQKFNKRRSIGTFQKGVERPVKRKDGEDKKKKKVKEKCPSVPIDNQWLAEELKSG